MRRSLRVSIASRIFAPEPAAASLRLGALADALVTHGVSVRVLTVNADGGKQYDEQNPYDVRRAPVLRDAHGYVRGYVQYLSFDVLIFFRVLFGPRQDLYIVEPPPTTGLAVRLALAIRRTPYAYFAADLWSDAARATGAPGFVLRVLRQIERMTLEGATCVLTVNVGMREGAKRVAPRARFTVVGNGADTRAFTVHGPRKEHGTYLVYAGTASEWQGAGVFVDAFARIATEHPDLSLVFVGHGSDWDSLQVHASRLLPASRVMFVGTVPPAEAAMWIRGATASLASLRPESGYETAFPTKVYASWACGTPLVYAGGGQVRDFFDEHGAEPDLGIACDYDIDAVADAMREIAARDWEDAKREELGAWAASNVSLQAVAERSVQAVMSSISGRAGV